MTKVTYVKELTKFTGQACLVRRRDKFFVVSSVNVPLSGPETLVFRADAKGNITNWLEVAGGRYVSRDEAIAELASLDFRKSRY